MNELWRQVKITCIVKILLITIYKIWNQFLILARYNLYQWKGRSLMSNVLNKNTPFVYPIFSAIHREWMKSLVLLLFILKLEVKWVQFKVYCPLVLIKSSLWFHIIISVSIQTREYNKDHGSAERILLWSENNYSSLVC